MWSKKPKKATSKPADSQPISTTEDLLSTTAEQWQQEMETPFLQRVFQVLHQRSRLLLCAMAAVVLGSSVFFYFRNNGMAGAVLSLNYEESTQGLTPSGGRFSPSEIRSEEVMTRAIEYAGLTGTVDPLELSQRVGVDSSFNRDILNVDEDEYIATSYYITLSDDPQMDLAPQEMLKLILKAYKDAFFEKYADTSTVFPKVEIDYSGMEYLDIVSYLDVRLSKLSGFLNDKINEDREFTSASTGLTFKQLLEMQNNLTELPYAQLSAYVWEHGIAKNADLSIQTLEYKNKLLRQSYEEYMDEYQIRTDTIDAYQNSMIDSVLIPTYDNNHEYYMSRTKIGIDDLALEAENYLEQAKGTQVSIDRNLDMIDKIELGSTDAQRATADAMIESLDAEIAELEALVTQVNREYLNAQTHNYLSVQFLYSGIVDKVNLKFGIALGVAVGAVLLLGFYLDTYRAPRKPSRKPSRKPRRKAKTAATT